MDAWLHVLDAVVELPAHLLREGGGEGLKALVHHPRHHGVPGGQGRHVAFALLREGAALAGGGIGGREEEEEHQEQPRHGEMEQGEALGGRQGEDSCRTPRTRRRALVFSLKFFPSRCWWRGELCAGGCGLKVVQLCAPKANIRPLLRWTISPHTIVGKGSV